MEKKIYQIVAVDRDNGIGKDGKLPWHFKKELKYFQDTTTHTEDPSKQNMVIMGRTTWESIPENHRPLPGRKNVVMTRNEDYKAEGATVVNSYEAALEEADDDIETIFVIGGGKVFEDTLKDERTTGLYITRINHVFDCDTFYPEVPETYTETKKGDDQENDISFSYYFYKK